MQIKNRNRDIKSKQGREKVDLSDKHLVLGKQGMGEKKTKNNFNSVGNLSNTGGAGGLSDSMRENLDK